MPAYFTGKHVASHRLEKSGAATFPDFIKQLISLPVSLSVTSDEYRAMSPPEKAKAKLVGYIVPCTFDRSPWEGRKSEFARACNLCMLDIDNSDDARRFVESPGLLAEALAGFNFAAYTTVSSTPENPRMRVVVDADAIPPGRYADAVLTLGQMLGLQSVTRESAIVTQAMFRPTVFADQDPDLEQPLLLTVFTGRPFLLNDIARDLDSLPGMVSGNKPSRVASSGDSMEDFLTFYRAPVEGITLEIAGDALTNINADCTRPEWLEVAAALRHQFAAEQDDGAYEMFDSWSQTGTSKYVDSNDTRTIWKSFSEQPKGRAPTTIRSLLKRAAEGGWDSGPVKEASFKEVSNWLLYTCKTVTSLMSEGVKRIAAATMLSHTEEDALLQTLVRRSRLDFLVVLTTVSVRKDLKKCKDSLKAQSTEVPDSARAPWTVGWVYVAIPNVFFRPQRRQMYTSEAIDRVYSRKLFPAPEELLAEGRDVTQNALHTPKVLPALFLLNHIQCQAVDDTAYCPAEPEETFIRREGKLYVNIYRRSFREADKSLANYAEDVFCDHMVNLIGESENRTILMDWIAHNVQFPGIKVRWAWLMQGGEGCGKTYLASAMSALVGSDNINLINLETLKKGWNDWAFGSQVIAIEEIRVAGQNRHEIMTMLKEPITNDYITVNERNRATRTVPNATNLFAFTNHHDALALNDDSRRWFVVKSPLQHKEQIEELKGRNPGYFSTLFEMLKTHSGGLRHMFENRTIRSDFNANGPAPASAYLREMVDDSGNELTSILETFWMDQDSPYIREDVIASVSLQGAIDRANLRNMHPQYTAKLLRDMGYRRADGRHVIDGVNQFVWYRPTLINNADPVELLLQREKIHTQSRLAE